MLTILILQGFVLLTSSFRVEVTKRPPELFHIESEVRKCGCEEQSNLNILKNKELTPQDFMIHHGKLWLGSIKAEAEMQCGKLCPFVNRRTTHFAFESKTYKIYFHFYFF
jgi:hypothetical protein